MTQLAQTAARLATTAAMATSRSALRTSLGAGISLTAIVVLALSAGAPGARDAASLSTDTKMRQLHSRMQELLTVTYGATLLGNTGTETGNLVRYVNLSLSLVTMIVSPTGRRRDQDPRPPARRCASRVAWARPKHAHATSIGAQRACACANINFFMTGALLELRSELWLQQAPAHTARVDRCGSRRGCRHVRSLGCRRSRCT